MNSSHYARLLTAAARYPSACSVFHSHLATPAFSGWKRAATAKNASRVVSPMQARLGHTVRIICLTDLPNGKAMEHEVVHVKAGYARNYLIPKKMALYATRQNFERLQLKDPDKETPEERRERLAREASDEANQDLIAANRLKKYFSNKHVVVYRKIPDENSWTVPLDRFGVTGDVIREKLSKQLQIDLEEHEHVCIAEQPLEQSFEELLEDEEEITKQLREMGEKEEDREVRTLGNYLVRIWLRGDHLIPLHLKLERHWAV